MITINFLPSKIFITITSLDIIIIIPINKYKTIKLKFNFFWLILKKFLLFQNICF